jgi:hypothetical protein
MNRRRGWCRTGKRRWTSESDALLMLLEVQNYRRAKGAERIERRAYRCGQCNGWHLTSSETPPTS